MLAFPAPRWRTFSEEPLQCACVAAVYGFDIALYLTLPITLSLHRLYQYISKM